MIRTVLVRRAGVPRTMQCSRPPWPQRGRWRTPGVLPCPTHRSRSCGVLPPADFYHDAALPVALNVLRAEECALSEAASAHVQSFCSRNSVSMRASPGKSNAVSASFVEEMDHARDRLLMHSRHSDLVVLGGLTHRLPALEASGRFVAHLRPADPDRSGFPAGDADRHRRRGLEGDCRIGARSRRGVAVVGKSAQSVLLHIVEDEPHVPSRSNISPSGSNGAASRHKPR